MSHKSSEEAGRRQCFSDSECSTFGMLQICFAQAISFGFRPRQATGVPE